MLPVVAIAVALVGAWWLGGRRRGSSPSPSSSSSSKPPSPSLSERAGKAVRRLRHALVAIVVVVVVAAMAEGCDETQEGGGDVERVPCTSYDEDDCPVVTTPPPSGQAPDAFPWTTMIPAPPTP